jgi:hypothetical protein
VTTPVVPVEKADACRSCRRPIEWVNEIGWLHGDLPQYAHEPITCNIPHPVSCTHRHGECPNGWTP